MNGKTRMTLTARAAALLLLGTGVASLARAQEPAPPPTEQTKPAPPATPGGQGEFGLPAIPGGAGIGRMMMMGLGQAGIDGPVDVTHSNAIVLLKRVDVRTKLAIGNSQHEALEKLATDSQKELGTNAVKIFQPGQEGQQDLRSMSPEERNQAIGERMKTMQNMMETSQENVDKRVETILRPAQASRLRQVDLQWRGPLALSEEKLADAVGLTKEQREKIKPLLEAYQTAATQASMKSMMGMGQAMMASGGINPQAMRDPASAKAFQTQMQTRLKAAMLPAKLEAEKVRKAQGAKVLALLTPEQAAKWQTMNGPKFVFGAE